MALWGGRFESGASSMFKQVNDSLPFDQVMASQEALVDVVAKFTPKMVRMADDGSRED